MTDDTLHDLDRDEFPDDYVLKLFLEQSLEMLDDDSAQVWGLEADKRALVEQVDEDGLKPILDVYGEEIELSFRITRPVDGD